jgi:hypothetical protein
MSNDAQVIGVLEAAVRAAGSQVPAPTGERMGEKAVTCFVHAKGQHGAVCLVVPAAYATPALAERLARCLEVAGAEARLTIAVSFSGLFGGPLEGVGSFQAGPGARGQLSLSASSPPAVHITHTLREASKLSETKVLAIGNDMRRVSELAKHHADGLKQVSGQLACSGSSDEQTVSTAINVLEKELRTFMQALQARTAHQASEVAQARVWTTDIMRLGQAISDIASSARILTFNARVESARIGEAGKGFAVIAQAIQDLATQIRATNDSVSTLAHNLSSSLPKLGLEANGIAEEAKRAMKTIESQIDQVESTLSQARSSAGSALNQGVNDAAELQTHSYAVLEHLQFQDRASQMLVDAMEQVEKLLHYAQVEELPVEHALVEQVGKLGREMKGNAGPLLAEGSVEMF